MSINQLPAVTREINSTKILEAISGLQSALTQANALLTQVAGVEPVTNVTIDSSSGLATAELQGVGNTGLATISGTLTVISGKVATTTLQTAGNLSLSNLDAKWPAQGQALMAASVPVVVASNQTSLPVTVANGAGVKIYDEGSATYRGLTFLAESPQVCAQPYGWALAEGDIPGHVGVVQFGFNPDIDNKEEDVWELGGAYTWPAAAAQLEVVSSNIADDGSPGGTGVQKVRIYYLTNAFVEKSEEVTLDGTTPVLTAGSDIYRVNDFLATQIGTGKVAAGNISLRVVGGAGATYAYIAAGFTRSRQLIYTVPVGKTLYITNLNITCGSTAANVFARFILQATYDELADATRNFFLPHGEVSLAPGSTLLRFDVMEGFPAGTDIRVSGIGSGAASNIQASITMRGWIE